MDSKDCISIENCLEDISDWRKRHDPDIREDFKEIDKYAEDAAHCCDESDIQSYIYSVCRCANKIGLIVEDLRIHYSATCELIDDVEKTLDKYNKE